MLNLIKAMSRSPLTRLFAAALLVPLIAFATATSGFGLRCRITGIVFDACCCPADGVEALKAEAVTTVSSGDCCDRVVREVSPAVAELTANSRALSDPPAPVTVAALERSSADLVSAPPMARPEFSGGMAPPPTVRFRLVAKSAFLI
jgi:hypothetical protein